MSMSHRGICGNFPRKPPLTFTLLGYLDNPQSVNLVEVSNFQDYKKGFHRGTEKAQVTFSPLFHRKRPFFKDRTDYVTAVTPVS